MSSNQCDQCGSSLLPDAKFCSDCGFSAVTSEGSSLVENEWRPGEQDFAERLRPQQLSAWLTRGLNVDESQTGLLFESGRFQHELTAGRQKLESLPERIKRLVTGNTATAVLIRRGYFPLTVMGRALTSQGDQVVYDCELGLQIGDRNQFYVNLMQDRDRVVAADLLQRLAEPVRQAVLSVIAKCKGQELLNLHPELRERLDQAVQTAVLPIAERWGLQAAWISTPVFSNEDLVELQQQRGQMHRELRSERLQQDYRQKRAEIEARNFAVERTLAEAEMKRKIEEAERTLEFDQLQSELQHRRDVHGLQLQEQLEQTLHDFQTRKRKRTEDADDQVNLRQHLLATARLQRDQELARLRYQLRKQDMEQQLDLEQLERDHRLRRLEEELQADLKLAELQQQSILRRDAQRQQAVRESLILDAETDAKVTQIQGEAVVTEDGRRFDEDARQEAAQHQQKVQEITDLEKLQREHLRGLQELELQKSREQTAIDQDAADREHKRRMEEQQLLSDGPEMMQLLKMAELAVQSPAMTDAFGEVMKMAMAKGMTAEQLEQVMASQSKDVAQALQEKYRAQAAAAAAAQQTERDMFERLLVEVKSAQQVSNEQLQDFIARFERMGVRTHEVLGEVGKAAGGRQELMSGQQLAEIVEKTQKKSGFIPG